jgi:DNA modification methylase
MKTEKLFAKYSPTFNPRADYTELKDSEYNPRKSTEKQYQDLRQSIRKFGTISPIIVNSAPNRKNIIIGGHFRRKVCIDEGIVTGPVIYVNIPDIKEEQELCLRLNKNVGEWDVDLLANIDDIILADVGFDLKTIDQIFANIPFEDDFSGHEEYQKIKKPETKPGDLIELGHHRLLCGDSTKEEDLKKLMNGKKADICFTDPPYNVNYVGRGEKNPTGIMNDNMTEDQFIDFSVGWAKQMSENLKTGGVYYICSGYSSFSTFLYALKMAGTHFSQPIIWVKDTHSMGWNDFRYKHETILKGKFKRDKKAQSLIYGWNKGKHYFDGVKDEADVWTIKRRSGNTMVHPTQKPIEMMNRALVHSSKRGDLVLDLFGGSGGTLISAAINNRICYMIEHDPKYCDVIRKRYEAYERTKK